jgi:outer membrane protein TolC
MRRHQITFAVISLLLASCAVGPDYQRPEVATQATFKEAGNWKVATPNDDTSRGKWWEAFGDRELNLLVEQIDINNQNLKLAEAKYRQAQALGASARSSFFPTVSASASETRSKSASGRTGSSTSTGAASSASSSILTNHNLSASFSWELDLWGRIRRQVESNDASIQASAADLESARLSAQSELASNYFQLRVNDAQKLTRNHWSLQRIATTLASRVGLMLHKPRRN